MCFHIKCVFITAGHITKLCAWGEEDSGGHVRCQVILAMDKRFVEGWHALKGEGV